jgi:hypothetical protein
MTVRLHQDRFPSLEYVPSGTSTRSVSQRNQLQHNKPFQQPWRGVWPDTDPQSQKTCLLGNDWHIM